MQVKATKRGFYGYLRDEGDVFEIASADDFSKSWMEAVEQPKAEKPAKQPKAEKPSA